MVLKSEVMKPSKSIRSSRELNKDLQLVTGGSGDRMETKGISLSILGRNSVRKRLMSEMKKSFERAEKEM